MIITEIITIYFLNWNKTIILILITITLIIIIIVKQVIATIITEMITIYNNNFKIKIY